MAPVDPNITATVARMELRMKAFGADVRYFTSMAEQDCPAIGFGAPGKIRWWRWNGAPYGKVGWDLLRTAEGVWMGWPVGMVAHPPLFAQVYPNSKAEVIASIDGFGGFVIPKELPYAQTFERELCPITVAVAGPKAP